MQIASGRSTNEVTGSKHRQLLNKNESSCVQLKWKHLKVSDNYLGDGFLDLGAPERKDCVCRLADGGGVDKIGFPPSNICSLEKRVVSEIYYLSSRTTRKLVIPMLF